MEHKLPTLPYAFDALEPFIDAETMHIHYERHHGTYINNLNVALEKYPYLQAYDVHGLIRNLPSIPEDIRMIVRNNGGGHANHTLFWETLKPFEHGSVGGRPFGTLAQAIAQELGGYDIFKENFKKASMSHFGSGWAFLSVDCFGKLVISTTVNQDSTHMHGFDPILNLDLWEHAYYLKYRNKRVDYVEAFFEHIDWEIVDARYQSFRQ